MYQLYYDGRLLYDPRAEELAIRDPDTHLAVGEAGSLAFTIDHDHPFSGSLAKLRGVVDLRADGRSIFKGRVIRDTRDFNRSRRIEVEGLLACLNDSIIPPFEFPTDFEGDEEYAQAAATGNVVAFFLGWLLQRHNDQVGPAQQIRLGEVTVADPNNFITRSNSEHATTMETVRSKLEDPLGGYLLADYSGEATVLHYYAELPLTNTQRVEFGGNLLDLVNELDASDTYTAILPLGKDGLTLEDLPDGEVSPGYIKSGKIIYSTEAEAALDGARVVRLEKWSDVTLDTNLRSKALDRLAVDGPKLTQTITVKAVDLGVEEANGVSRFVVGRQIQVDSKSHDFSAVYPLMELEPDLLDPKNTTIVLGATVKSSSDFAKGVLNSAREIAGQQNAAVNARMDRLTVSVETQITEVLQSAESIIFGALESYVETSDFEEYSRTVTSQLELLAEEIVLRFTEAEDHTTDVDGDLQRVLETLEKHFVFSLDDGLTIRAGEHSMNLALDNNLIIFKRDGQQFGWWDGVDFHTGNIVIDVTERAQFGNFAFVPRSNGSLSFLKVGG